MASQEHVEDHSEPEETVESGGVSPSEDLKQATQQVTQEAVESASARGEHVVEQAKVETQRRVDQLLSQATRQKERTADRIQTVAGTLRERSQQFSGGQTTQKVTDAASEILHSPKTEETIGKVRGYTRSHPGRALAIAGAIGFFFGRKLFR